MDHEVASDNPRTKGRTYVDIIGEGAIVCRAKSQDIAPDSGDFLAGPASHYVLGHPAFVTELGDLLCLPHMLLQLYEPFLKQARVRALVQNPFDHHLAQVTKGGKVLFVAPGRVNELLQRQISTAHNA